MAISAAQTVYRQEFIAIFEETESLLSNTCIREAVVKGNQAVFLNAGSNDEIAVTRGLNSLIPAADNYMATNTATLAEWHHLVQETGFNIFQSQGPQTTMMQRKCAIVINRKMDSLILTELLSGTLTTGSATTASVAMVAKALGILGNNGVRIGEQDKMFAAVSPSFWAYLMQTPEFSSVDYVDMKTYTGQVKKTARWFGVNWIIHSELTGVGTSTERCFMWHQDSMGLAIDSGGISFRAGYHEEQDYSWARASVYAGVKLLQNTGIVEMTHDGSGIGTG